MKTESFRRNWEQKALPIVSQQLIQCNQVQQQQARQQQLRLTRRRLVHHTNPSTMRMGRLQLLLLLLQLARIPLSVASAAAVAALDDHHTPTLFDRAHHLGQTALGQVRRQLQQSATKESALAQICSVIESAFDTSQHAVHCDCGGTVESSLSISCEYTTAVCQDGDSDSRVCGKPQIAVSLVDGRIFSATSCVSEYYRGLTPLADTCVFVDACRNENEGAFCDCTASYGGKICGGCSICPGGDAITVDCSDVNPEAISQQCTAVDLDLDLAHGAGAVAGFAPVWEGFCTQLEKAASPTNNVACDCSDAVGSGDFDISCSTKKPVCVHRDAHCGQVASNVAVVDGAVQKVTACADYTTNPDNAADDVYAGQTCTEIEFCDEGKLCGCRATFDGTACNACEICQDGSSLTLDCSNVRAEAVVAQCQAVSALSAYEFLPRYKPDNGDDNNSGPSGAVNFGGQSSANKGGAATLLLSSGLLLSATFMLQ